MKRAGNHKSRVRKKTVYRRIMYVIFILYLLILFKIILFKYFTLADVANNIASGGERGFRSLNLIPFVTFRDFGRIIAEGQSLWGISNILGNMCVFAPLGYFLPLLFYRFGKLWKAAAAAFGLSLFFELGQYFLYLGSADIDDVILNVMGACAGYGFYRLVSRFARKDYVAKARFTIALSVLCFVCAFLVAREQFGAVLGFSTHKTEYEGKENIPDRDSDCAGTYLGIEDGVLRYYRERVAENSEEKELLSVCEAPVTKDTKYVSMDVKEEKRKSIIRYSPMTDKLQEEITPYRGICLWFDDDGKVDTILFTGKVESIDKDTVSVSRDKDGSGAGSDTGSVSDIWGEVTELTEDGFTLNMGIDYETEDGSVATIGHGESANPVEIKLASDAVYERKIVHDQLGTDIDYEDASKEELEIGQSVDLEGRREGQAFVAEKVTIREYDFIK